MSHEVDELVRRVGIHGQAPSVVFLGKGDMATNAKNLISLVSISPTYRVTDSSDEGKFRDRCLAHDGESIILNSRRW